MIQYATNYFAKHTADAFVIREVTPIEDQFKAVDDLTLDSLLAAASYLKIKQLEDCLNKTREARSSSPMDSVSVNIHVIRPTVCGQAVISERNHSERLGASLVRQDAHLA